MRASAKREKVGINGTAQHGIEQFKVVTGRHKGIIVVSSVDQLMKPVPQRRSLIAHTADALREQISIGTCREFLPGERELAAALRVSRPTVRAALELLRREGLIEVAHGRRRRICNVGAKRLRTISIKHVALLTPQPLHQMPPFVMIWVNELRERLIEAGFIFEVVVSGVAKTADPQRQLSRLVELRPAAAWILFLSSEAMQQWFTAQGLPCVVAGSCFPGIKLPSVDIDARSTCRHAAGLFLAKGHQSIALLLPEARTAGDEASAAGFLEAVRASRIRDVQACVVHHDGTVEGICKKIDALVARANPVTALLVARSVYALTAQTYLQRKGIKVPQQMTVVSRDSDKFLEFAVPTMARYACNPLTFARRVSNCVLRMATEGMVAPRQIRLTPELVKGETIA